VVENCPAPVLTIPSLRAWNKFSKVLFPVRAGADAVEKYEIVRHIVLREKSSVHVAAVVGQDDHENRHKVTFASEDIHNRFLMDDVVCHLDSFDCASLPQKVLDIAGAESADLITISSTSRHSLHEFFSSSFAQGVVEQTHVPVLSIKPASGMQLNDGVVQYAESLQEDLVPA
jgi:hypothetical protein